MGKAETDLKDSYGNPLRSTIYFGGDGLDGDIYFITLDDDGKTFLAESLEGLVKIEDHSLFARQLIPLSNPRNNLEFALTRLVDQN
ncbi:MAG: hypothetical protein AABX79_01405 [Nanoarchaeota archaeon]